jgi:hypothetical protein
VIPNQSGRCHITAIPLDIAVFMGRFSGTCPTDQGKKACNKNWRHCCILSIANFKSFVDFFMRNNELDYKELKSCCVPAFKAATRSYTTVVSMVMTLAT